MRPRIPQREEFNHWCIEKLRNADTDQFHHVNNAVLATLFEAGRMEFFAEDNLKPLMCGANLAVVRLLMNFHREVFYPGQVSVGTRLLQVGDKSFRIEQGIFDREGCAASAEAVCVLLDIASSRAMPVCDALREQLLSESERK
jgi:acyl-CoA thioester hydrolase